MKGRATIAALCIAALSAALAVAPASGGAGKSHKGPVAGSAIIGGGKADPARWPFMAAVVRKGRLHCGGSVIAPTKVLTAAHCVEGFNPAKLDVVVGRPALRDRSAGASIDVIGAAPHPDYVFSQRHDVGVITLAAPTSVPAIRLPTAAENAEFARPGRRLRVAGWGARNPYGLSLANVLKRTTERVRTNRRCRRTYRSAFGGRSMICALGKRVGRFGRPPIHNSACSGDSGGPLVADTPAGPVALGTVSYGGIFCGLRSAPTVYSRVSDSLPFIGAQLTTP